VKSASVRELKSNTSGLLRLVKMGEGVLITSHGKPVATLSGISEEAMEDFLLSYHPEFRESIESAYAECRKKGGTPIEEVIDGLKKKHGKNSR
jgi:prevent-host-death family protein